MIDHKREQEKLTNEQAAPILAIIFNIGAISLSGAVLIPESLILGIGLIASGFIGTLIGMNRIKTDDSGYKVTKRIISPALIGATLSTTAHFTFT